MPAVLFHARTRCARCEGLLPVDGVWTTVPCPSCDHANPVPPEAWAVVLKAVVDDPQPDVPVTATRTVGGRLWEIGWRAHVAPSKTRSLPSDVFADGVFPWPAVADEGEPAQVEVVEAIAHVCPRCAAPVRLDGTERNPTCESCGTTFLLPDAVWTRLHPPRDARPFTLELADARAEGFGWIGLYDLASLPDGDLIVAAMDADGALVARLDRALRPRWRRHDIQGDDLRMAVTPDGRILLADPNRHSLSVLSLEDGSPLGNLGGKEPAGATFHHLDVHEAMDLVACTDGTLFVSVANRLVRYDAGGKGVATWPPAKGFFAQLWGTEKSRSLYGPDRVKNGPPGSGAPGEPRPHAPNLMLHPRFVALPAGGVLICSAMPPMVAYRRDGTVAWTWTMPEGTMIPMFHRPAAATDGSLWTAITREGGGSHIWRRSPRGATEELASTQHYITRIAPLGADEAWLFGQGGEVWKLAGGELRAANAAAIEREQWDAEYGGGVPEGDAW